MDMGVDSQVVGRVAVCQWVGQVLAGDLATQLTSLLQFQQEKRTHPRKRPHPHRLRLLHRHQVQQELKLRELIRVLVVLLVVPMLAQRRVMQAVVAEVGSAVPPAEGRGGVEVAGHQSMATRLSS